MWVDKSSIPSRAEKMSAELMPLMEQGLPLWVALESEYPEILALLKAGDVDPKELLPPQVMTAMIKAGLLGGTPVEEDGEGEAE